MGGFDGVLDADRTRDEDGVPVLAPADAAEVAEVLRHATAHGLAVRVRGGGTKPEWGPAPTRVDAILSTERLARVIDHAPGDMTCVAEAGLRLADLQAALPDTDLATLWELKRAGERAPGAAEPPPAIAAFLARRWCANDPIGMRAMAEILCTCSDLTDDLAAVVSAADLPVAVIWGAQDDAWPVASQAQLARRLGASATCLPTAGHSPNTEAPAALVTALRETWPLR